MTRRSAVLATILALLALCTPTLAQKAAPADLILRNGHVYTSNPAQPWVEAVAIRGNHIVAVGSEADVGRLRSPRTQVIDLGGRMAMPGILDSHIHFLSGSQSLPQIHLDEAETAAEMLRLVKEYAAAHFNQKWLLGRGWVYSAFKPSGLPTKEILDQIVPDRPVVLENYDGHSIWVNSKALELAGIKRDTPDPKEGDITVGIIVRDPATGEATGVLKEAAVELVNRVLPKPTREQNLTALRAGMKLANQHGVTSVLNATGDEEEVSLYAELHRRGELTVRMTTALGMEPKLTPKILARYEAARRRYRGPWVRAGVIKAYADGVIESHTAGMLEPYSDDPLTSGSTNYSPAQFDGLVRELDRRGFQVITHAIGDRAIRMVLDAYEKSAAANGPRDRRFRIEHIENINPADIPRFGKLGVIASMQPYHAYPEPNLDGIWARNVGPQRLPYSFAWHDIAAGGARLSFGSDWPVVSLDPFIGLQNAVTRQRSDGNPPGGWVGHQKVTLEQALAAYTRDAAYAQFEDKIKGSLELGKLADVIVLSQDLTKIDPLTISKTTVLLTMVDGKIVWRDPAF